MQNKNTIIFMMIGLQGLAHFSNQMDPSKIKYTS
jgi:hypothetical protein